MIERFRDRREAGRWLAEKLYQLAGQPDVVVLALPRGGVPIGAEIASRLYIPLQVFVVRKLGVPGHEEYAMGAIAPDGNILLNEDVISKLGISQAEVQSAIAREEKELDRRTELYGIDFLDLHDRTVVLVDDGLATGSTMKAAAKAVRQRGAAKIIIAVPVAPNTARAEFEELADEFITIFEPSIFYAVGQFYEDFSQTTDEEVRELLNGGTSRALGTRHESEGGIHGGGS